ncbi:PREDICTED: ejaculatory bulb-specific protein 3-like [Wasmannia auropunctata]|uniref:ejaculatory bulb-specific protein 3-like n=1 Tax=Wasmannia auropunctata TaxID=64793 RepID=UPI0005EE9E0E|nr:PREDICTED: ejaculatory bulb-specific protein 3-like [Wasmannia auropunctata]
MARLSFILTIVVVTLACVLGAEETYSDRYDDVDIEGILANQKLREQYYNCFIGNAPCRTADAKFFSGVLGEAMQTQCKKCTEKQKALLDRMADWYTTNKPDAWEALIKKQVEDALKKSG